MTVSVTNLEATTRPFIVQSDKTQETSNNVLEGILVETQFGLGSSMGQGDRLMQYTAR